MNVEVRIVQGLRAYFLDLRILQGLGRQAEGGEALRVDQKMRAGKESRSAQGRVT